MSTWGATLSILRALDVVVSSDERSFTPGLFEIALPQRPDDVRADPDPDEHAEHEGDGVNGVKLSKQDASNSKSEDARIIIGLACSILGGESPSMERELIFIKVSKLEASNSE